jgi:hypothetical protein
MPYQGGICREKSFPSRLSAYRLPFIRCPTVRGGSRPIRGRLRQLASHLFRSSFEFIPLHNPSNAISSRILLVTYCNDLRLERTRMNFATPRPGLDTPNLNRLSSTHQLVSRESGKHCKRQLKEKIRFLKTHVRSIAMMRT